MIHGYQSNTLRVLLGVGDGRRGAMDAALEYPVESFNGRRQDERAGIFVLGLGEIETPFGRRSCH